MVIKTVFFLTIELINYNFLWQIFTILGYLKTKITTNVIIENQKIHFKIGK
jgi:hypothetical protein